MTVEIVYFEGPGRVDLLKLLAQIGNVDHKVTTIPENEWPAHKLTTRYGQLPYLKINEKWTLYQTLAIARYLAQQGGLYPSNIEEATISEEFVAALDDLLQKYIRVFFIAPPETKEQELKTLIEGPVKTILTALEKVLEENGDGYLIKGKLTWADFALLDIVYALQSKNIDLSYLPLVLKSKESIKSHPRFKYYATKEYRKQTL